MKTRRNYCISYIKEKLCWHDLMTTVTSLFSVHQNYVGCDVDKEPFFLSVVVTDANNHNVAQYRAILWRKTVGVRSDSEEVPSGPLEPQGEHQAVQSLPPKRNQKYMKPWFYAFLVKPNSFFYVLHLSQGISLCILTPPMGRYLQYSMLKSTFFLIASPTGK